MHMYRNILQAAYYLGSEREDIESLTLSLSLSLSPSRRYKFKLNVEMRNVKL